MGNPDVITPEQGAARARLIKEACSSCVSEGTRADCAPCANCEFQSDVWKAGEKPSGWVPKLEFPKLALPNSHAAAFTELEKELIRNTNVPTAPDILAAAEKHMRDRAATYDKPEGERSMAQTVAVFNTFHGTSLTEAQGWHFMQILKDVRLFTRDGYHADSAEDGVAYAGLKAEAKAKE